MDITNYIHATATQTDNSQYTETIDSISNVSFKRLRISQPDNVPSTTNNNYMYDVKCNESNIVQNIVPPIQKQPIVFSSPALSKKRNLQSIDIRESKRESKRPAMKLLTFIP